eukprot:TRINITY_DN14328_c0_g1_i1.p1 TRINITY_DN14328_c0_g1~~TRINITY_DN14328_c0_g1_i1.p1  ORF type:complete len:267 (-),score=46.59 TRINITY_DN14328_c0_g1_i1:67-867(-)
MSPAAEVSASAVASTSSAARRVPLELEILELTNLARAEQRLPPLKWHRSLAGIAKLHATAVADGRAPFSHAGAHQRFAACSARCINVAENLARSDGFCRDDLPQAAVSSWCQSEGHRRNLLGPFDACGIGWAASDTGVIFVTQLLALLDERSAFRGQIRETAYEVATSTPAVCTALGLVIAGPAVAIGGGILGSVLDHKLGVKAATLPLVLRDRVRGLWQRHSCSRCGQTAEAGAVLWATSAADGPLLCARCQQSADASGDWCFVD